VTVKFADNFVHDRSGHFRTVSRPATLTDAGGGRDPPLPGYAPASAWRKVSAACRRVYDEVNCVQTAYGTVSSLNEVGVA